MIYADHFDKNYLELEQMRFGSRLNVIYDAPVTDFLIPPLTLQPIVENAVRHGIVKREEGGTLTISTAGTSEACTVTVTDDGIGFDPLKPMQDGKKTHRHTECPKTPPDPVPCHSDHTECPGMRHRCSYYPSQEHCWEITLLSNILQQKRED